MGLEKAGHRGRNDRGGTRPSTKLYRGSGASLARDLAADSLVRQLTRRFEERLFYAPTEGEVRSWTNSLPAVSRELTAAGLEDVVLPLCSRRLDVVVLGTHPRTEAISAVVWENKQWTSGEIEDVEERVVTVLGRRVCIRSNRCSRTLST